MHSFLSSAASTNSFMLISREWCCRRMAAAWYESMTSSGTRGCSSRTMAAALSADDRTSKLSALDTIVYGCSGGERFCENPPSSLIGCGYGGSSRQ
jgi:hypothetical protein